LPGGGGNRPGWAGGGTRPGGGGDRPNWPGGGGNRPPWAGGGGNRPNWPGGGGNHPNWPGGGGNRPPWAGGGGNRPNWPGGGGNRPNWPNGGGGLGPGWANNGNRPGWGNGGFRPGGNNNIGWGNGNNIGSGNIGQIGDNLGIVNRPNYGGNNIVAGNNFGGGYSSGYNGAPNVNINNNNVGGWGGGGWGGGNGGWGGGYGGGYGGWGGGYGGGYGGWASPYYGNWYRGSWGNAGSFWAGVGTGALTSFGLNTALGAASLGYGGLGYGTSVYNYFPTWGMSTYTDWGLGSVAGNWLYNDYSNPYSTMAVAAQPAATTVVYDYSQPINVAAAPPDSSVADSTEQVFSAARDAFKAGDYQRALDLSDQVLKQTPNVPVVHEFRALTLFAMKRYNEAAEADYAVLSAGPGWNWSTLVGLYPNVDVYTDQLRSLEAQVKSNPNDPSAEFLLGYHYMIQGHTEEAAGRFEKVTQLVPKDELSASFVKALKKPTDQPAPTQIAQAPSAAPTQAPGAGAAAPAGATAAASGTPAQAADEPPPPPPAAMAGTWKATPANGVNIELTLQEDGNFAWEVDTKGHKQTLEGHAGLKDGTLALLQTDGPPLVGKITQDGPNKFVFAPPGAKDKGEGLTFTR
jgi:tetratricopeptide (TPR) repeat protein